MNKTENQNHNAWRIKDTILVIIGILPAILACILYAKLPEQMAVHFNVNNQPDGYNSRFWAVVTLFLLGLAVPLGMKLTRMLDPKRDNFAKFHRGYEAIRITTTLFISAVGFFIVLYNIGFIMETSLIVTVGVGILFIVIGNYMGQIRYNYTFGVRTPWTLANEEVWRRTHRLAGPLWVIFGLLLLGSSLFIRSGSLLLGWVIGCSLLASIIPMIYSYVVYRRLKN